MAEAAIRQTLVERGEHLLNRPRETVHFVDQAEANTLLNDLEGHPHAFVIACVMDRQTKAERAWMVPYRFGQRCGSFEFAALERLTLEETSALFAKSELSTDADALHRFTTTMAVNFHAAIRKIADYYSGDASAIWRGSPSSATIVRRFLQFAGVGPKIATMAANILVRDFKIPVSDKISVDISADVHVRRVFRRLGLLDEAASNEELIYRARELNPTYPGVFDLSCWEIGRTWCRPTDPQCHQCYMNACCPTAAIRTSRVALAPQPTSPALVAEGDQTHTPSGRVSEG